MAKFIKSITIDSENAERIKEIGNFSAWVNGELAKVNSDKAKALDPRGFDSSLKRDILKQREVNKFKVARLLHNKENWRMADLEEYNRLSKIIKEVDDEYGDENSE